MAAVIPRIRSGMMTISRMTFVAMEIAGCHRGMIGSARPGTKLLFALVLLAVGIYAGCGGGGDSAGSSPPQTAFSGVLTYHNDNARTGQNLQETVLTPENVRARFGKLFSFPVDGFVYAQPLYVSNVPIDGQLRNVVFVATEHNSVYAFDADRTNAPLWHASFIDPASGVTTVPFEDTASPPGYTGPGPIIPGGCGDLTPEIGITGTPVIDPATGTLYVVAKT